MPVRRYLWHEFGRMRRVRRMAPIAVAVGAGLAVFGVPAAGAAPATKFTAGGQGVASAKRGALMHGVAGDRRFIFVTQPGVERPGSQPRVVALDRLSGRKVGELPQPPGGFRFPFALRTPGKGRLVVLDNAGFPPRGAPTVQEYRYGAKRGFRAKRTRTVSFAGRQMAFAEDIEVLPNGEFVVSESIFGGLWIVGRNGRVRPGLVSAQTPLAALGPCFWPGNLRVSKFPFVPPGLLAPGVGSLAVRSGNLYFGSSCRGGIHRLKIATLLDRSRSAEVRAQSILTVSPRPAGIPAETLKGLSFNRWDRSDPHLYVGDPLRLRLLRIDPRTGRRSVVARDPRLFDFTVATTFLPPLRGQRHNPMAAVSDQEYRWSALNTALDRDRFRRPFRLTKLIPGSIPRRR